jgi:hypothetical protein
MKKEKEKGIRKRIRKIDLLDLTLTKAVVQHTRSSNKRLSIEGNYSTVDVDTTNSSNEKHSMEGKYSTVDDDTRKSSNERLNSPAGT